MTEQKADGAIVELAANIVSAYVTGNSLKPTELPALIADVHRSLTILSNPASIERAEPLKPAVPIKKSIHDEYIICLEDGKKFKSLKRHLSTHYNLTPEEYRSKWGLPADYPMVAPSYAAARSELAKSMGLGRKKVEAPAPAKRSRKKPTATAS
ncbi:MAG: MucR family transcriptional regulator [Hyphomicrobiales bacterium]|nr:MAG: MucR family transcriptional regulator [Hyphomicrobiales bacterium]